MALINCKECNAEVSDTAFVCPKCGFQLRKPERSLSGNIIRIAFWIFIVYGIYTLLELIYILYYALKTSEPTREQSRSIGEDLIILIVLGILVYITRPKK